MQSKNFITTGGRRVGTGYPAFIVAELSGNHHQKFDEAVAMIRAAKEAGADAVKLQTYTPDTITIDSNKEWFRIGGEENPDGWKGKTLYELYQTAYTPWDWQPKLKKVADEVGIFLFSSPFDETAVDFLERMDVPCFKVASYEVNDVILLKKIAHTGKPVIMSIGYAYLEDIELALKTLRENGAKDIAILHCVTGYTETPDLSAMHLRTIQDIADRFGVVAGFSDNNRGIEIPIIAAAVGASIIEKHFILNRADGGPDAKFSIEPGEFKKMVIAIRRNEKMLGEAHYGPATEQERHNMRFRRSLFVVKDMKKGEKFSKENIRSIRPADGLHTKHYEEIIGRVAVKDIERGTPLSWSMIV